MNNYTQKIWSAVYKYSTTILVFLCSVLFFMNCERQKDYDRVRDALVKTQAQNQTFQEEVGKNNEKIASQAQIILTQKEAIDAGLLEIEKLKNVKSQVKVVTNTTIDTIYAELQPSQDTSRPDDREFSILEEWYAMNGVVNESSIAIRELQIKNEFTLTIADKKLGFLKTPEPSVILVNKNPYTSTQEMQNIVVVYKQPFYRKPWFWTGVGIGVGYLIPKK